MPERTTWEPLSHPETQEQDGAGQAAQDDTSHQQAGARVRVRDEEVSFPRSVASTTS